MKITAEIPLIQSKEIRQTFQRVVINVYFQLPKTVVFTQ